MIDNYQTAMVFRGRNEEDRFKFAEDNNLVVIEPNINELFIDIDNPDKLNQLYTVIKIMYNFDLYMTVNEVRPSKTQGHYHVIVNCDFTLDVITRIALQVMLGSDPNREAICLAQYITGFNKRPTAFFERK